jgi:zinc/manganese transport system permease protein
MFAHEFVRNAFLAGTPIALACGLVGYFVVLRAQVFAGDALSHVAFTGALAAAAAGIDLRVGLFAATILVGLAIGALGERAHPDDVTIGIVFAWILGLGVYFLARFNAGTGGGNGLLGARTLFGSIFGLSAGDARLAAAIAAAIVVAVVAIARPLLFSSIDPAVAAARGVPVRALGLLTLALLGATTAEATQAIGALLLLGLLAAPAGTAHRLTAIHIGVSRCPPPWPSWRCGAVSPSATRSLCCRRAARSSASPAPPTRRPPCSLGHAGDRPPEPRKTWDRLADPGGSHDPGPPPVPSCGNRGSPSA